MKKMMFLVMAFGVFAVAAGNVSAQSLSFSQTAAFQSWADQGFALEAEANLQKICSKDGGEQMDISWKNNTKMTLRINWVNTDCVEETNDREIKPGEVYDGTSYVGHWFLIRDFKTGKLLGRREVRAQYANMGIPK